MSENPTEDGMAGAADQVPHKIKLPKVEEVQPVREVFPVTFGAWGDSKFDFRAIPQPAEEGEVEDDDSYLDPKDLSVQGPAPFLTSELVIPETTPEEDPSVEIKEKSARPSAAKVSTPTPDQKAG